MTRAALFSCILALCAWISIPVGDIAFTMQTFGMFLTLGVLGGKWGSISIGIYLLLGAAGMPVFAGFQGGPGILLGATGGYLWGFLASGILFQLTERWGKLPAMILGLLACYLCGSLWFSFWAGANSLTLILLRCVVPYLIPDAIKLALAHKLSLRLGQQLRK